MKKSRPILMSTPMVRALLEGRKTQTRRVVKPQPYNKNGIFQWDTGRKRGHLCTQSTKINDGDAIKASCPYGGRGDLLWVRETWMKATNLTHHNSPRHCLYRADGECIQAWKPSIHMPKWASRITLEITDIRVEQLQDISEEDAVAEGIDWDDGYGRLHPTAKIAFSNLWESINGKDSWEANPWVWVIEFKPHFCNVSEFLEVRR